MNASLEKYLNRICRLFADKNIQLILECLSFPVLKISLIHSTFFWSFKNIHFKIRKPICPQYALFMKTYLKEVFNAAIWCQVEKKLRALS